MKALKRATQIAKRPLGGVRFPSMKRGMRPRSLARAPQARSFPPRRECYRLGASQRNLLDHLELVALEADDLLRVVGEQPQPREPQVFQDLRADAELAQPGLIFRAGDHFFV